MTTIVLPVTRAAVVERLRWIVDPEIGLDIVALGLIYDVAVHDGSVHVAMTLTTRGCPLHATLADGIRDVLLWLDGVARVELDLVWEPRWHPAMIEHAEERW